MIKSLITLLKTSPVERLGQQLIITHKQSLTPVVSRFLHITSTQLRDVDKESARRAPRRDEGTEGESFIDIDAGNRKLRFPDETTQQWLFNGVPYKEIPIVNIKCSKNNTLMNLAEASGKMKVINTCGTEGFKNARKGTNVAAQATAITLAKKALQKGYKTVRVRVAGLGPGRMAAVKGLQTAGMDIISITDNTKVTCTPLRPRKARRV